MTMNRLRYSVLLLLFSIIMLLLAGAPDAKVGGIMNTRHNLSITGPGELKALTETRVCVFCHTPHNAAPRTPLWNKQLEPVNYDVYASTSLHVTPGQPTGPSRLCLSCHDGTVALGSVIHPAGGIATTGEITPSRPSFIGTSLRGHHPIAFSYLDARANPEIYPTPPLSLHFYGASLTVHCTTCHDPHDDSFGKFLVMDNRYSALCTQCHVKNGWSATTHRTSAAVVSGVLPIPPRTWPAWLTVAEWGCEECHTPHSAGALQRLLYFNREEDNCYFCHNGTVAKKNIYSQFQKISIHKVAAATGVHSPTESPARITDHVECVDCHEPHTVNSRTANAPFVSGRLDNVTGVDITGSGIRTAAYEYQICFKCHADSTPSLAFSPGFPLLRAFNTTNLRTKFNATNPSFHPVEAVGKNMTVPSIPSQYMLTMTASSVIYCTDCHDSDESISIGGTGPKGPHGSVYPPILRERYETTDNTMESFQTYALCYRCHNRDSILANQSFKRHQQHIVNDRTPCSICHDPHGIPLDTATGNHTHLINFDTRSVLPYPGQAYPKYTDTGGGTGSCLLVCHSHQHFNSSY